MLSDAPSANLLRRQARDRLEEAHGLALHSQGRANLVAEAVALATLAISTESNEQWFDRYGH